MKAYAVMCMVFMAAFAWGAEPATEAPKAAGHPDTTGWEDLFLQPISNADKPEGVWTVEDGVITASKDEALMDRTRVRRTLFSTSNSRTTQAPIAASLSTAPTATTGFPTASKSRSPTTSPSSGPKAPKTWQCGAIFGHLAASKSLVKKPGEWNAMAVTCRGRNIQVVLNGEKVTEMDMALWTIATKNPDGSEIPAWLSTPFAQQPTKGYIGLQGKHAGAPIFFRNLKVKELK